jgi:hypothetical protein
MSVRDVVPDHEGDLASGQPSLVTALVVDVPNERNPSSTYTYSTVLYSTSTSIFVK